MGSEIINVVGASRGLEEEIKWNFWDDLNGLLRSVPQSGDLVVRRDSNGHIVAKYVGCSGVCGVSSVRKQQWWNSQDRVFSCIQFNDKKSYLKKKHD